MRLKNLGLLKKAKNQRAILVGRNELSADRVEPDSLYFILLNTNALRMAIMRWLRFFFLCLLLVFLTLSLECRSFHQDLSRKNSTINTYASALSVFGFTQDGS